MLLQTIIKTPLRFSGVFFVGVGMDRQVAVGTEATNQSSAS
jgi:hypothetical protein